MSHVNYVRVKKAVIKQILLERIDSDQEVLDEVKGWTISKLMMHAVNMGIL